MTRDLSDHFDCNKKCSNFIGNVNKLIGNYGTFPEFIKSKLFKTHCCAFYGCQLWKFDSHGFK